MPCNSSYMDPTQGELNLATVYQLLDEIKTGKLTEDFPDGFDNRAYGKSDADIQKDLDKRTAELCKKLQKLDVKKYSLELQMWWRDHQKADKERIEKFLEKKKTNADKKKAMDKLTDYEKELLGLK